MTKRRINISIVLMVLAIVAVGGFQMYWLRNNLRDEKRNVSFRTNALFREAMQRVQAEKLHLDAKDMRFSTRYKAVDMLNLITRKPGDDLVPFAPSPPLKNDGRDTLHDIPIITRPGDPGGAQLIQVLRGVEPLLDSITTQEVSAAYAKLLKHEGIDLRFSVNKRRRAETVKNNSPPRSDARNEVTLGISHPITFRLDLEDPTWFIIRQKSSQLLVSFLLVGLTIFSFAMLLRNLIAQQRLTRLKNDFISNMTHELKTPIATVTVAIEALRSFNALNDPERTKEYLDISANELQRLSLLVDKVLKLSMFEKHQIELRAERVDLKALVEEVVSSMRLQFEKHKATVLVTPDGKDFAIKGDAMHVTSVIFNLLDNALKYSKSDPAIIIGLKETGNIVELSVSDTGIGIAPEYKSKIFEKFFRVPAGDTHNVKGYGLGLSYVVYVVQRHHGTIDVESEPGKGSRFIIKLPKTA